MITNILSVDVEEWFHPEALQSRFPQDGWQKQPERVVQNIESLLRLFDEQNVKATFFTLAWVARAHPDMIRKICEQGHEIASHGSLHKMLTRMTPDEFRSDLGDSIKTLEDISGKKVLGFRAPTFSVVRETFWSWEIMLELGLKYDSSVYPIWHDRYGVPDAPRQRYIAFEENGKKLIEFPMSTLNILGKRLPFGGGGYLRIFLGAFTRMAINKINKEGLPAIMYMHPWEFDTGQPKLELGPIQTWRHYYNISGNYKKLSSLLQRFQWTSFENILDENL